MNQISYSELGDMEYYNPNYKKEEWDNKTREDFMNFYKDNSINIDVTTWIRLNEASDTMIYKNASSNQICFIRDDIGDMFFSNAILENFKDEYEGYKYKHNLKHRNIKVDNTHMSKSILLPVFRIYANGKDDLIITISDNFYGYQVSVESKFEIDLDFSKLFDASRVPDFMYGFKKERIFKSYSESKTNFSFGIGNQYHLYMVMYNISELWKNK